MSFIDLQLLVVNSKAFRRALLQTSLTPGGKMRCEILSMFQAWMDGFDQPEVWL